MRETRYPAPILQLLGFELCLEVGDVDAFVEELRQAEVVVLAEPADQVWGERVGYVVDPDGNPVHIRGPVGESA